MSSDELRWLPFLLQTSDAAFPTGAYAHSLGFEESVRLGVVRDEESLLIFLLEQIVPAQREQELPYLRFAFAAAADSDALAEIDREISAWKLAAETRAASIQLGIRRLKALRTICPAPMLSEFERAISERRANGHHLVVCALQAVVENIPLDAALATYFYQSLASICAASLKLMRIGQDGCQRALRHAVANAHKIVCESHAITREDAGWFNPLLEIASMRHACAEERLFIS